MKITTLGSSLTKISKLCGLILVMFLLQACPYESSFPLTEKEILFPQEYLGTWYEKDGNEGVLDYKKYVFRGKDDETFFLDEMELNDYGRWENTTYECHLSYVGQSLFVNVKTTGDTDDGVFYLYNTKLDGDQMEIKGVTTNITKEFESSDSLYHYIDKYKDLDFFYSVGDTKTLVNWGTH